MRGLYLKETDLLTLHVTGRLSSGVVIRFQSFQRYIPWRASYLFCCSRVSDYSLHNLSMITYNVT